LVSWLSCGVVPKAFGATAGLMDLNPLGFAEGAAAKRNKS
jgi:hypothetical protein